MTFKGLGVLFLGVFFFWLFFVCLFLSSSFSRGPSSQHETEVAEAQNLLCLQRPL